MKKPRNTQSPRRHGGRPYRKIVRVLTEGKVTEPSYINMWARKYLDVRIDINLKDTGVPLTLVRLARKYQKQNKNKRNPDYDEIWCIFDVDEHPDMEQAIQEARDSDINVAISNPCFELWLVLHYQDQTRNVGRHTIQSQAKELGITDGKKITAEAQKDLLDRYNEAKTRAKQLESKHEGDDSEYWENPSSQVWRFVDRLALLSEVGDG